MPIDAALIDRLRRMVAEPDATLYDDDVLATTIAATVVTERTSVAARAGYGNAVVDVQFVPQPAAYDLHAAAAVIWEEKLAALIGAGTYDLSVDGRSFSLSQKVEQFQGRMSYHLARRRVKSVRQVVRRAPGPLEHLNADIDTL